MSLRIQLWLVFLAPVLIMAGLYGFGLSIPVPHLGRDYVLSLILPDADEPEVIEPEVSDGDETEQPEPQASSDEAVKAQLRKRFSRFAGRNR